MTFEAAVCDRQEPRFAVVVVEPHVIRVRQHAEEIRATFQRGFAPLPVVLFAYDQGRDPAYYGPWDIVPLVTSIPVGRLPWRRYSY
jgi:hypothetical protein